MDENGNGSSSFTVIVVLTGWVIALLAVAIEVTWRPVWPVDASCGVFALIVLGAIALDLSRSGFSRRTQEILAKLQAPLLFSLTVIGCLWLLFHGWRVGAAEWYSAGPVTPYSDASEYVSGAKSLITFGELGEISARRPLATNIVAVPLWLTNQGHQKTLLVLALVTAFALFCAVRQTCLAGGYTAAILYLGLGLSILSGWVDSFMTERAGFIFACFSYAILLYAFRRRFFAAGVAGFGFLVLSQTARPGAILVLPILGLYLAYAFARSRGEFFRRLGIIVITGLALLGYDSLVSAGLGPKVATYQGNISFSLYGLAVGGKPWSYVLTDHPEVARLTSDGEQNRYVYELFWQQVRSKPEIFARAVLEKSWRVVRRPDLILFGLVRGLPPWVPAFLGLIGLVCVVPGMGKRESVWAFCGLSVLGVLLSAPFLFDGGDRIYMSIVAFPIGLAIVPVGFAAKALQRRGRAEDGNGSEEARDSPWLELSAASALVILATAFPFWIAHRADPEAISHAVKQTGLGSSEGLFYFNPESGFQLGGDSSKAGVLRVPGDFVRRQTHFNSDFNLQAHLAPGNFLCHAFLLVHPVEHDDVIQSYLIFDHLPAERPGYLTVTLQFLEQKGASALFKVLDFHSLEVPVPGQAAPVIDKEKSG